MLSSNLIFPLFVSSTAVSEDQWTPTQSPGSINEVCRFWVRGNCRFGEECRFLHSSSTCDTGGSSAQQDTPSAQPSSPASSSQPTQITQITHGTQGTAGSLQYYTPEGFEYPVSVPMFGSSPATATMPSPLLPQQQQQQTPFFFYPQAMFNPFMCGYADNTPAGSSSSVPGVPGVPGVPVPGAVMCAPIQAADYYDDVAQPTLQPMPMQMQMPMPMPMPMQMLMHVPQLQPGEGDGGGGVADVSFSSCSTVPYASSAEEGEGREEGEGGGLLHELSAMRHLNLSTDTSFDDSFASGGGGAQPGRSPQNRQHHQVNVHHIVHSVLRSILFSSFFSTERRKWSAARLQRRPDRRHRLRARRPAAPPGPSTPARTAAQVPRVISTAAEFDAGAGGGADDGGEAAGPRQHRPARLGRCKFKCARIFLQNFVYLFPSSYSLPLSCPACASASSTSHPSKRSSRRGERALRPSSLSPRATAGPSRGAVWARLKPTNTNPNTSTNTSTNSRREAAGARRKEPGRTLTGTS